MIITIAGTSGAGKSTAMVAVREWLSTIAKAEDDLIEGRSRPFSTRYYSKKLKNSLVILGAYDSPTGGCDTINDVSEIFETIETYRKAGYDVLYEGLFVMNMTRGPQLAAKVGKELTIFQLTTSLEECLASVDKRRAERGVGALETTKNTRNNFIRARNYCATMRDAGAKVVKVSRAEVLPKIKDLLLSK